MSREMRFPTMWYVRPAKPQISLCIRAVWSEPLLVAWTFYEWYATDWSSFGVSKIKRRLHRLVWFYTCQNATLLEITWRCSIMDFHPWIYSYIEPCFMPIFFLVSNNVMFAFYMKYYMCLGVRKPVFVVLRTTRVQTSLRIRTVWSAPFLFTDWKIWYVNLLWASFNFLANVCSWAGRFGYDLVSNPEDKFSPVKAHYCKFGNFRENFIFAKSVRRHICEVQISRLRRDLPI